MGNGRVVFGVPTSVESPRVARAAVRDFAVAHGLDGDPLDVALLVATELVANAVAHGKPPITLELELLDDRVLRIEVCDAGTFIDDINAIRTGNLSATGRGLKIVRGFARAWRVERRANGKSVSAEINVRPHATE